MTSTKPFVAAAVQAAPVFLDRAATIAKACDLIADAASRGAKLIVLPETFVPSYPSWIWVLPLTQRAEWSQLHAELLANAVTVPGPETEVLGQAARAAGAWVAIGINELNDTSRGTLYNTLLIFAPDGTLVSRHRKLMPTGSERLVWARSEEADLRVFDTELGRLSGLICWENYMPLARYALYAQGAQVHLAPTWDKSEQWLATMRHVAREGRAFVIGCCSAVRRSDIPERYGFRELFASDWVNTGNSLIVDPEGVVLAGPLAEQEGILLAEIDPAKASGARWLFDAAGHYDRPDLFTFAVKDKADRESPLRARPARRRRGGGGSGAHS